MTIKELEAYMKLVKKYNLKKLSLPDGTIICSEPTPKRIVNRRTKKQIEQDNYELPVNYQPSDEDLLFLSSSAPAVRLDDLGSVPSSDGNDNLTLNRNYNG